MACNDDDKVELREGFTKKSSKKCGEGRLGKSPDFLLDFFVKPSLIR